MKFLANQQFRPLFYFNSSKKRSSFIAICLTVLVLNLVIGCSYYNVRNVTTTTEKVAGQINEFNKTDTYAVMHSGEEIWHLNNLVLNEDNQTISGTVDRVKAEHIPIQPREKKRVHRYTDDQKPLNELHFYLTSDSVPEIGTQIVIPFSNITSLSVNDKNSGRTVANAVFGTLGVVALILLIYIATKSSCPFIYVKDGEDYVFTGELYPGIITANQQRDDYLLLPTLANTADEYSIKITNELKEIQYTDVVTLLEIEHPREVQVLLDKEGHFHTFSSINTPKNILVDNLTIDSTPLISKDNTSYHFDSNMNSSSSVRSIELEFIKPVKTNSAKLFLTLKNSFWLDYVFGKFNEQFGTYYGKFQKDQQNISAEKSIKWIEEQNLPLSIYLKTSTGWELIDRINTVGPMAFRDIAVPIDLSNVATDEVTIKLETGFMFWEVNYVGIDYSENLPLQIKYISPYEATDEANNDITDLLLKSDNNYFVQPNIGDEAVVHFKTSTSVPGLERTYFLKNRGYYNYIRNFEGEPDFKKLKLFREAGAFTDFSMYEYEALLDYENRFQLKAQTK